MAITELERYHRCEMNLHVIKENKNDIQIIQLNLPSDAKWRLFQYC